ALSGHCAEPDPEAARRRLRRVWHWSLTESSAVERRLSDLGAEGSVISGQHEGVYRKLSTLVMQHQLESLRQERPQHDRKLFLGWIAIRFRCNVEVVGVQPSGSAHELKILNTIRKAND